MIEKVKPTHIDRKAILYVRQSSTHQVFHHLESQRLQYAMKEQLETLGWRAIDVIDEDLGKSAGGSRERSGFERLVAEVCLAKVGVVAAWELSRFARNSREWQQLIEVCRVVDTLLVDQEAIYDARQSNDRLLLGLKGSLNEYELDLFRQRSQKARQQKALRAELGMNVPVGFVNAGEGRQEKHPDQRVQQAIHTIFEKFLELGTARQVMMWFLDRGLEVPYGCWEDGVWKARWRAPTYHGFLQVLKHPIYAGAYAWGRTRSETVLENGKPRRVNRVKLRDEWLVLQRDHHEGYITWATYERIQEMIHRNAQVCASVDAGAAKRGPAMLAGLIRCRRCGRKLNVRYASGGRHRTIRYVCHQGFQGSNEEPCIAFSGASIDDAVVNEVMRVIQPGAVESALLASQQVMERHDQGLKALELELQTGQYEAERARRQYDASDPENRLVTAELERRWNTTMERVAELERRIEQEAQRRQALEPPTGETFLTLAQDVHRVWDDPRTDNRLKKRILRALIEEVIADVDATVPEIHIVIHWKGGVHTELRLPRRRSGETRCREPKDVVEAVGVLSRLCSDENIAAWLTRNGLRTAKGNCWTRQHVTGLRHRHGIAAYKAQQQETEGWMSLSQAAAYLGISCRPLSVAIQGGEIPAIRPLPVGPLVLKRTDLDAEAGQRLSQRIERQRTRSGIHDAGDETLVLFNETGESPGGVV